MEEFNFITINGIEMVDIKSIDVHLFRCYHMAINPKVKAYLKNILDKFEEVL